MCIPTDVTDVSYRERTCIHIYMALLNTEKEYLSNYQIDLSIQETCYLKNCMLKCHQIMEVINNSLVAESGKMSDPISKYPAIFCMIEDLPGSIFTRVMHHILCVQPE